MIIIYLFVEIDKLNIHILYFINNNIFKINHLFTEKENLLIFRGSSGKMIFKSSGSSKNIFLTVDSSIKEMLYVSVQIISFQN